MFRKRIFRMVTGHFVPRSFHTQVISRHFGHFVPTFFQFGHFISSLVISYPVWSFRTYFYYFLENRFGHFVPIFYCFVPKSFRTRCHFVPILVTSYPGHLRTHFQTRYELTWVRNDFLFFFFFFFCCNNCYFQTWYELTLV